MLVKFSLMRKNCGTFFGLRISCSKTCINALKSFHGQNKQKTNKVIRGSEN